MFMHLPVKTTKLCCYYHCIRGFRGFCNFMMWAGGQPLEFVRLVRINSVEAKINFFIVEPCNSRLDVSRFFLVASRRSPFSHQNDRSENYATWHRESYFIFRLMKSCELYVTWYIFHVCKWKSHNEHMFQLWFSSLRRTPFKNRYTLSAALTSRPLLSVSRPDTHMAEQWLEMGFSAQNILKLTNGPESFKLEMNRMAKWMNNSCEL